MHIVCPSIRPLHNIYVAYHESQLNSMTTIWKDFMISTDNLVNYIKRLKSFHYDSVYVYVDEDKQNCVRTTWISEVK